LKTSRFKSDAFSGDFSFDDKGKVVKFKLEETMRQPLEVHSTFGCDIVEDDVIEEHFGSDDEISVSKDMGIRGVSDEWGFCTGLDFSTQDNLRCKYRPNR